MIHARPTYTNINRYEYSFDDLTFGHTAQSLSDLIHISRVENEPLTFHDAAPPKVNHIGIDFEGDLVVSYEGPTGFMTLPINPDEILAFATNRENIIRHLRELGRDKKITAIKLYRAMFGVDLSEAKDQIEALS